MKFAVCGGISVIGGSLPSRERGLKSVAKSMLDLGATSLPSRERGLKSGVHGINHAINEVAPLAGAWIEMSIWNA